MIQEQIDIIDTMLSSVRDGEQRIDLTEMMFGGGGGPDNVSVFIRLNLKALYTVNWVNLIPPADSETGEPDMEGMSDPTFNGLWPAYDNVKKLVHDMDKRLAVLEAKLDK